MALRRALMLGVGMVIVGTGSAAAQGLVDLHAKVRVGNKLCMADHFHDGNSNGHSSRKEAERAAIRAWQGFTAWEYGSAWGNFHMAASRGVKCSNDGGSWSCHVQARPCRRR